MPLKNNVKRNELPDNSDLADLDPSFGPLVLDNYFDKPGIARRLEQRLDITLDINEDGDLTYRSVARLLHRVDPHETRTPERIEAIEDRETCIRWLARLYNYEPPAGDLRFDTAIKSLLMTILMAELGIPPERQFRLPTDPDHLVNHRASGDPRTSIRGGAD